MPFANFCQKNSFICLVSFCEREKGCFHFYSTVTKRRIIRTICAHDRANSRVWCLAFWNGSVTDHRMNGPYCSKHTDYGLRFVCTFNATDNEFKRSCRRLRGRGVDIRSSFWSKIQLKLFHQLLSICNQTYKHEVNHNLFFHQILLLYIYI